MQIDRRVLKKLWPNAPDKLVSAVADTSAVVLQKYNINTPLRLAHFLAQISHESNGGTITEENLNYTTAARIAAVWPSRFTQETAQQYVRNPRKLASRVYNGRMGNVAGTEDGYNYRGRGLLQLTGRAAYKELGAKIGLDLEGKPDLAYAPGTALEVAAAEFVHLKCLPACDSDDLRLVTRRVNGGFNGLEDRKRWLAKWKLAIKDFPGELPATQEGIDELDQPAPRGAEPEAPKSIAKSDIGNGAVVAGAGGAATLGMQIWEEIKALPDSLMTALTSVASKPAFWLVLLVVAAAVYIWRRRRNKLIQQGV